MTIMTIVTRLIMTIILKCIENTKSLCCRTGTLTPQCWRSIILQKGTNKFMEKDGGEGELDEGSQKAQTSSYKINRLLLFSVIKSCPTLWDSVDYSTSASSVLHYLLDCSNSCPLSWWHYITISSSAIPFSFCLQSFPASGSFPVSWLFESGSQSTRAVLQ